MVMIMMMARMMCSGGRDGGGDVATSGGGGGDDAGGDDIDECVAGMGMLILAWAIVVMMAGTISVGRHAALTS